MKKKEKPKKFIQKMDLKKGALRKELHVPEGKDIPAKKLAKAAKSFQSNTKEACDFGRNLQTYE